MRITFKMRSGFCSTLDIPRGRMRALLVLLNGLKLVELPTEQESLKDFRQAMLAIDGEQKLMPSQFDHWITALRCAACELEETEPDTNEAAIIRHLSTLLVLAMQSRQSVTFKA